ncbi:MAG TPA: transglycosylase domain-containing protein [Nocardioidaceae bacterium]|nr:transglycosylase domain-containing protein [Nocardioidaceae bacterium]
MSGNRRQPPSREPWPWQKQAKPASHARRATTGGTGGGGRGGTTTKKKPTKPAKPRRPWWRVWLVRLVLAGLVGVALLVIAFFVAYASTDIPDPNREFQTEASYVYYSDGETEIGKFATQNRDSVELEAMGQYTANAVIAAEDQSFYSNSGIDIKGILRAAFSNASGNSTQGGSTITQQYVKVLYLTQELSYSRKIKEAMLSLKLSNQEGTGKDDILQGYLNTIYFGRGAYGIEAAARAYFGKTAGNLTLKESAALAGVLNSPENYDPADGREARAKLFGRYGYVLRNMEELGSITASQYSKASRRLPKFPKITSSNGYTGQTGYIMQMVRDELHKLDFTDEEIDGSGLRITTTIDPDVMEAAEDAVEAQRPEGLNQLHIAVASVDPKTGGLKGLYAGAPFEKTQGGTNWALTGQAPGSTFKPFALATGLSNGYSLKSTFDGNSPLTIGNLEVGNQGDGPGGSYGRVSLLTATQKSINTAYVDLTDTLDDGPDKVIETAVRLGIPRKSPGLNPDITVALGSADIRPIDMANAYATIANAGVEKNWFLIERVNNADDENLYKHRVRTTRAVEEDVANDVSYALQQVVKGGTGTEALNLGRPAAGKTGTSTTNDGDVRASWFVGFTPQLATAVMYVRGDGNDPLNGYMPTFYGGEYPARTWTDMMSRALEGTPIEEFPPPGNVEQTAEDHLPAPTFTPKPTPKPSKTPKPTLTPTPTLTLTETPSPTDTLTLFPSPTCTPCDSLICPEPPCDPGPGNSGGGGPNP